MPPFIPRKRPSASPPAESQPPPSKRTKVTDVSQSEPRSVLGLQRTKTFSVGGSDDSDSSLSDVDSDQFEDVPSSSKRHVAHAQEEEVDEDEDIEWEDAAGHENHKDLPEYKPQSDGPIEITLRKKDDDRDENWLDQVAANMKKAPSKRDKQIRICSHQLHVQFLLWHNAARNRWISDRKLQQILVQQLPVPIEKEIKKWKRASALAPREDSQATVPKSKRKGKQKATDPRQERDWGRPSQRLEEGKPDMSNGDPLIILMKVLSAYWVRKFAITAPGLRKRGYGTARERKQTIRSLKNNEYDLEEHGERVQGIQELREMAKKNEGSRDVGAQLFTALLRGLGIEARLVASLQPTGYGWTKAEQMLPKKATQKVDVDISSDDSGSDDVKSISEIAKANDSNRKRKRTGTTKKAPDSDSDDSSIIDITPSKPRKQPQKYDRDHPFPIYWTEAISPITNKVLPVSPLVIAYPVATNAESISTFEPRGIKAEKTKTVMAYVVAYSSDGSAKDVTVRYLKKQIWPGKTKGFRYPVEKVPVYTKHGKIKRYEEYDWFKRVMSFYIRPDLLRTPADDIEDATDLVPQQAEQKSANQDVDTLQSLKTSPDFVLERFLRREEALRPGSQPVREFVSGKGENLKHESVYRRADVERCLTAESWHKEGRRPLAGEAPLKLVPVRAVTITRKREAEEHERVTGEKQKQGLYSWDQTEYIIPPPIVDGIIPKNSYGNIDCFVPSMVPRGAVHVPLRGTVRICKRLEIDFAEAVTGFEFGNKRAVPVCTGVVVAKEYEKAVREAWREYNEAQRLKEEKKLESIVLETWRRFVIGLRIRERVRDTYGEGDVDDLVTGKSKEQPIMLASEDEMIPQTGVSNTNGDEFEGGGGFLLESDEEAAGSDLEVGYHPNDDREMGRPSISAHSVAKGKEREAEAEYPTPISPLKPAVRRQRPGNFTLADPDSEHEDGAVSELASALPSDEEGSDDDAINLNMDVKPTTRRGLAETSSEDNETDESEEEVSDEGNDEDDADSDDYTRARSARRPKSNAGKGSSSGVRTRTSRGPNTSAVSKRTPTNQSAPSHQRTRTTTRSTKKPDAPLSSTTDAENDEEDCVMPNSNSKSKSGPKASLKQSVEAGTPRKRILLRRDSTLVTSPYFAD